MDTFTQEQISNILDKKFNYIKESFFNLGVSERIVRGKMPTLEMCSERFLRFIRPDLFSYFYQNFDISFNGISEIKYQDYINSIPFPSSLNIVKINPLQGYSLINIEYSLLFYLLDSFFGGGCDMSLKENFSEFTPMEKIVNQRFLEIIFDGYEKSWESLLDINIEFLETEINPRMTNIAGLSDLVVINKFHVSFNNVEGYFHICMPNSTIDPIRDLLSARVQMGFSDSDERWHKFLLKELNYIDIKVNVFLTSIQIDIFDLMQLQDNDVIMFSMPEKAIVYLEDIPSFKATIGSHGDSMAVSLDEPIVLPKEFDDEMVPKKSDQEVFVQKIDEEQDDSEGESMQS